MSKHGERSYNLHNLQPPRSSCFEPLAQISRIPSNIPAMNDQKLNRDITANGILRLRVNISLYHTDRRWPSANLSIPRFRLCLKTQWKADQNKP